MAELKILTDIEIRQSPLWCNRTDQIHQGEEPSIWGNFSRLLKLCGEYDVVITANIKTAQMFGFFRTLFRREKPRHIILELMLDEARNDFRWKLKNILQRFCFSSVDVIFVSAKREIAIYAQRLGLPEDRIQFLPFHTNVVEPRMVENTGDYVLSAGRTGRDYFTLAAAVEGLATKVVVVSDRHHLENVHFPPNVKVFCNISYEKYLELLYGCKFAIVPLKKLVKSTGQVVFLEAMALGKPVIATCTTGTEDYIEDGKTGLLVPPENVPSLRQAIECLINDPVLHSAMAKRALEIIKRKHTFEVYTQTILDVARQITTKTDAT